MTTYCRNSIIMKWSTLLICTHISDISGQLLLATGTHAKSSTGIPVPLGHLGECHVQLLADRDFHWVVPDRVFVEVLLEHAFLEIVLSLFAAMLEPPEVFLFNPDACFLEGSFTMHPLRTTQLVIRMVISCLV